jgi:hypothetical protein
MPGVTVFSFFRFHWFTISLQRYLGPVPHDASYYAKGILGGALACGLTHAGITPLDVAKCNMQVNATFSDAFFPCGAHTRASPIGQPH